MKVKHLLKVVGILIFTGTLFFSCNITNNEKSGKNDTVDSLGVQSDLAYEKAKVIFYSLPSPVETALLLEGSGITFNEEFLNPASKLSKYNTSRDLALNMGVYGADLSFCSLFEQNQKAIHYMAVIKEISEELNIINSINDSLINLLQENMNDKNKVLSILSETFVKSNTYLEENDRNEIAALIIAGGWIEGLYISSNIIGKDIKGNADLVEVVIGQGFTLEDLLGLLEMFIQNQDVKIVYDQLKQLKVEFDLLQTDQVTEKQFNIFVSKVNKVRNSFTL